MNSIRLSILIPVYNVDEYLRDCLDSVLSQNFEDFEVICVNDGSTDGSLAILREFAARDSRVIIIDKRQNEGLLLARKSGVEAARGKYVTFVDSDDLLLPGAAGAMVSAMDEKGADFIHFGGTSVNYTEIPNGNAWIRKNIDPSDGDLYLQEISDVYFIQRAEITNLWGKVYKRELCQRVFFELPNKNIYVGEDIFTFFFVCLFAQSCGRIPDVKVYQYNYGLGVSNQLGVSLEKFALYCNMNHCARYIGEYLDTHGENEIFFPAYHCVTLRMIEDCLRMFSNRISITDKQKAANMLFAAWGNMPEFEIGLQKMLKLSAADFKFKYIDVPVERFPGPCFDCDIANDLKHQIDNLSQEKRDLENKNNILSKQYSDLSRKVSDYTKQNADLSHKVNDTTKKNVDLSRKVSSLTKERAAAVRRSQSLEKQLSDMRSSVTFRIGRAVTWLPRKIRGAFRCCREHGIAYTVKYAMKKLR